MYTILPCLANSSRRALMPAYARRVCTAWHPMCQRRVADPVNFVAKASKLTQSVAVQAALA